MIRVFIVDDHALVRTGYRLILEQAGGIEIIGEAATGEEALPLVRRLHPEGEAGVAAVSKNRPSMQPQACGIEISQHVRFG